MAEPEALPQGLGCDNGGFYGHVDFFAYSEDFDKRTFRYPRWDGAGPLSHNANMAEKRPFYLRQWRKHRGYTLERLAEMVGMSQGYLSDLEKQKRRWNEDHLESLAIALQCEPADFLTRDPSQPEGLARLIERVPEAERDHLRKVIETFTTKTGTDG